ncbi:hypothetical protein MTO96_039201 [Rhipicephalus appendiculatus]
MLKFAGEHRADSRIHYRKLDIVADEEVAQFVKEAGHFQRVYSFLAFHWIAEQRTALKNIETLLTPGGECFLVFGNSLNLFDLFVARMDTPRWNKYSDILLRVLPETRLLDDICSLRSYLVSLVQSTNLVPLACEVFPVNVGIGLSKETTVGK